MQALNARLAPGGATRLPCPSSPTRATSRRATRKTQIQSYNLAITEADAATERRNTRSLRQHLSHYMKSLHIRHRHHHHLPISILLQGTEPDPAVISRRLLLRWGSTL